MLSFCTRLIERCSLSGQHTPLEVTSPVSTCWHRTCALLRRAYPNDGNAESASSARGAGSRFGRKQMLSQLVPTARRFSYPNAGNAESASSARVAGSRLGRKQMLSRLVCKGQWQTWGKAPYPTFLIFVAALSYSKLSPDSESIFRWAN